MTRVVAAIWVATVLVVTTAALIQTLTSDSVQLTMPVAEFWPALYPSLHVQGTSAVVTGGGFTSATVSVAGLDVAARLWLAAGTLLVALTQLVIAIMVLRFCTRLLSDDPAPAHFRRALRIAAFTILIGGLCWQVCFGISGTLASQQVLGRSGWDMTDTVVSGSDLEIRGLANPAVHLQVDFWPILVALALLAASSAFQVGAKMQSDREQLLVDRQRLVRETEGLV
ncbi:hypothetical protein [Glaciihabitans sp. dw_435]|uniref:hypothetical protein n=1 Tax=Glaciihabitans sp. dw_435 TaxID=2720081 RepID=UPI001BD3341C|nr:hypothetical protein [Glaciihabitans sp. dw_435]